MRSFLFFSFVVGAVAVGCGGSVASVDGGVDGSVADASSQDGTIKLPDGAVKKTCGQASDCAPADYCDLNGHCEFAAQKKGTCTPRPVGCPEIYSPTCACDGKVYSSPCDAHGSGVDVNKEGGCPAPAGWISCGQGFCPKEASFCTKTANDAIDPNDPVKFYYQCSPLPPACQNQTSCSCFPSNTPCSAAQCSYKDGFTIMCPGG